jgi:Na+/pantothenate symporter
MSAMAYVGLSSRMARVSSAWKAGLMLVLLACVALDAARAAAPVLAGRMPVSRTNLPGPPLLSDLARATHPCRY